LATSSWNSPGQGGMVGYMYLKGNIELQGHLLAVEQRPVVLHPLISPHPVEDTLPQHTHISQPVFRIRIRFLRIRIRFLRIQILDFFPNPDPENPDPYLVNKKLIFQRQTKFWEKFLFSTQKVGILFLFQTNQVGILLNRELLFGTVSFSKISENH